MSKKVSGRRGVTLVSVLFHLLPAVLLFSLFAAVGILHVTSRVLVVDAGYRLSEAEATRTELTRENDRLKLELATLKTPSRLGRLAREQLGMGMAPGSAIVSLPRELPVQARKAKVAVEERGSSAGAVQVADRSAAP